MHEMKSSPITLVVASFHGTLLANSKFLPHMKMYVFKQCLFHFHRITKVKCVMEVFAFADNIAYFVAVLPSKLCSIHTGTHFHDNISLNYWLP